MNLGEKIQYSPNGDNLLNIITKKLCKNIFNSLCRGKGKCGKCRIRVLNSNKKSGFTPAENQLLKSETIGNVRLACQVIPKNETNYQVEIIDIREYHDNLFKIQDTFTDFLLNYQFQPNIIINGKKSKLGAVVDIGTTSIVLTIIDLETGLLLGADSILNPQIDYGRDIMTRLTHALESSNNQKQLQIKVLEGISTLINRISSSSNIARDKISELIIVGNTVMHHLFLNLPIEKLARSPFIPTISEEFTMKIKELDPENLTTLPQNSIVTMPPLIGSFIGSDAVVDILYTEFDKLIGIHLLIDFGTNSEIILAKNSNLYAASVAAGGAFEGQHINCGMRGIDGAIEKFKIIDGKYYFDIINHSRPKGICGTGIIDILAELFINGQLDYRGRLFTKMNEKTDKIILFEEAEAAFNQEIYISRSDVESIQKAKAATMAAIRTLTKHLNIEINEIDTIHIAGVFGSKLNIRNAKIIGLLPDLDDTKFRIQGNTAEKGGRVFLLSQDARNAAKQIANKVQRCELTTFPEFQSIFTEELFFSFNTKKKQMNNVKKINSYKK